jgi:hypothetical protein
VPADGASAARRQSSRSGPRQELCERRGHDQPAPRRSAGQNRFGTLGKGTRSSGLGSSAIGTLVERSSRSAMLLYLPPMDGRDGLAAVAAALNTREEDPRLAHPRQSARRVLDAGGLKRGRVAPGRRLQIRRGPATMRANRRTRRQNATGTGHNRHARLSAAPTPPPASLRADRRATLANVCPAGVV